MLKLKVIIELYFDIKFSSGGQNDPPNSYRLNSISFYQMRKMYLHSCWPLGIFEDQICENLN